MTTFFFVRHGTINRLGADLDPPLTEIGVNEATVTAVQLADQPIDQVYASPLARATETAAIIAAPHELLVFQDDRLRERASFGSLPDQTVDDFIAMWERCNVERTWNPPVGDSSEGCGRRVEAFIADVQERQPQGTVVAASHGGAIADFLLNVFALDEIAASNPALAATPYSGDVMRECSTTVVDFDGTAFSLRKAASIDHLPPAAQA